MAEIIWIKRRPAGSVVSTPSLIQRIIGPKTHLADLSVRGHAEAVVPRSPVRFRFENVSRTLAKRPHTARWLRRIETSGQRRVDIHSSHSTEGAAVSITEREYEILRELLIDAVRDD